VLPFPRGGNREFISLFFLPSSRTDSLTRYAGRPLLFPFPWITLIGGGPRLPPWFSRSGLLFPSPPRAKALMSPRSDRLGATPLMRAKGFRDSFFFTVLRRSMSLFPSAPGGSLYLFFYLSRSDCAPFLFRRTMHKSPPFFSLSPFSV